MKKDSKLTSEAKKPKRNILFFCYGDSTQASTWSNVPFLMGRALEEAGFSLIRVDLSHQSLLARLMNKYYKAIGAGEDYNFTRSPLFKALAERKIRRAIKQHPEAEMAIFLMMDFTTPPGTIPCLIFSDWTLKMLIEDRHHRQPTSHEQSFIERQNRCIEQADIVLPLFRETYDVLRAEHPEARNIFCIDGNVVNLMLNTLPDADAIVREKYRSNSILFVGRPAYKSGLQMLLDSISPASGITVNVIGMTIDDIPDAPAFCRFHGYLRKDVPSECEKYYQLMLSAKCICNPTSGWSGYSSLIEGMYLYTPVVVAPFKQFTAEFGEEIDFGYYAEADNLQSILHTLFALPEAEYAAMAVAAHKRVHTYTWSNYAARMIDIIDRKEL